MAWSYLQFFVTIHLRHIIPIDNKLKQTDRRQHLDNSSFFAKQLQRSATNQAKQLQQTNTILQKLFYRHSIWFIATDGTNILRESRLQISVSRVVNRAVTNRRNGPLSVSSCSAEFGTGWARSDVFAVYSSREHICRWIKRHITGAQTILQRFVAVEATMRKMSIDCNTVCKQSLHVEIHCLIAGKTDISFWRYSKNYTFVPIGFITC